MAKTKPASEPGSEEPKKPSSQIAAPSKSMEAPPPVYEKATAKFAIKKPKADPNVAVKAPEPKDILLSGTGSTVTIKNVSKEDKRVLVKAVYVVIKAGESVKASSTIANKYFGGGDYAIDSK